MNKTFSSLERIIPRPLFPRFFYDGMTSRIVPAPSKRDDHIDITISKDAPACRAPNQTKSPIARVHLGQDVSLNGCTKDRAWCHLSFFEASADNPARFEKRSGWVRSSAITVWRGARPYTFDEASSWFHCPVIHAV